LTDFFQSYFRFVARKTAEEDDGKKDGETGKYLFVHKA